MPSRRQLRYYTISLSPCQVLSLPFYPFLPLLQKTVHNQYGYTPFLTITAYDFLRKNKNLSGSLLKYPPRQYFLAGILLHSLFQKITDTPPAHPQHSRSKENRANKKTCETSIGYHHRSFKAPPALLEPTITARGMPTPQLKSKPISHPTHQSRPPAS